MYRSVSQLSYTTTTGGAPGQSPAVGMPRRRAAALAASLLARACAQAAAQTTAPSPAGDEDTAAVAGLLR